MLPAGMLHWHLLLAVGVNTEQTLGCALLYIYHTHGAVAADAGHAEHQIIQAAAAAAAEGMIVATV